MEELWDLSAAGLRALEPVHGLLFLFKYRRSAEPAQCIQHEVPGLFFAKQVINNACGTQALLNILCNRPGIELGPELANFKAFTAGLPPDLKGMSIGNSEVIRTVHNSFSRQETFSLESRTATDDDDVFHFVAYVPVAGRIYELDGLNEGPVDHGPGDDATWLDSVGDIIQRRIATYPAGEQKFNLCAVVGSRKAAYEQQLPPLQARMAAAEGDEAALLAEEVSRIEGCIAGEIVSCPLPSRAPRKRLSAAPRPRRNDTAARTSAESTTTSPSSSRACGRWRRPGSCARQSKRQRRSRRPVSPPRASRNRSRSTLCRATAPPRNWPGTARGGRGTARSTSPRPPSQCP